MAVAFSGFPVCPSSPRELVNIDAARIHTVTLTSEANLAGNWGERFRAQQDRKLMAALGLGPTRPVLPAQTSSPRQPSSRAGSRLQGGCMLTSEETDALLSELKAKRREQMAAVHRPLMGSPRRPMPHYYGCSLHGASKTNTDPRVGGTPSG